MLWYLTTYITAFLHCFGGYAQSLHLHAQLNRAMLNVWFSCLAGPLVLCLQISNFVRGFLFVNKGVGVGGQVCCQWIVSTTNQTQKMWLFFIAQSCQVWISNRTGNETYTQILPHFHDTATLWPYDSKLSEL